MKEGNWVPISKCAVRLLPKDRAYTPAEALLSIMVNYDNGVGVTVSGLAKSWSWGREKVRTFLKNIGVSLGEEGKFNPHKTRQVTVQVPDRFPTGSRQVKAIDSKAFKVDTDRFPTGSRQVPDRFPSTINDPNPNPNKKEKELCEETASHGAEEPFLISSKGKALKGENLTWFNSFWEAFQDKRGRAGAIDSFLQVKGLNVETARLIYLGAKKYAGLRPGIIEAKGTPKMAEGWLTKRRWEDEGVDNKGGEWI